jgi:tripartite-type tricarboxylate transporter receptor subunit TctC
VFLPAGTPKEIRDKLEQALLAIVASPAMKERFAQDGTHGALDHEAFAAMLAKQFAEWPERIKTLGISGE